MEFDSKWLFWFNLSPKDINKLFATKIGSTNLRKKKGHLVLNDFQ